MSTNRDEAVRLLTHYFTITMQKAGLTPDSDTNAEIAAIVDAIIAAAVWEADERRIRHMYPEHKAEGR